MTFYLVLYGILSVILIMLIAVSYRLPAILKHDDTNSKPGEEKLNTIQNFIYTGIILVILALIGNTFLLVKDTPRESHLMEWLNIVIRVMHFTFGIAWIGASFYFVFLENALNRTENVRDELAGNLWAVHGGGFYYLEKYKVAPKTIPKHLHWFKYEAYFTWLSGFSLLFVVYYFNASAVLIDKNVLDITPLTAISIGIGSFIIGWIMYDLLCKSPLIRKPLLFATIGFVLLVGFAWFYTQVFSSRAAYIHFGAMIGGIMVANVFFCHYPITESNGKSGKGKQTVESPTWKKRISTVLTQQLFYIACIICHGEQSLPFYIRLQISLAYACDHFIRGGRCKALFKPS